MNVNREASVAIIKCQNSNYPLPPFNPPVNYPEYPFKNSFLQEDNHVYHHVREMLFLLGLDKDNYNKPAWNPLKEIVHPGDRVILKPNLVISEHKLGLKGIEAATVHGSLIRPFVDYTYIALKGEGRITIGDSPIKEVDFEKIIEVLGITEMAKYLMSHYPNIPLEIIDFRDLKAWRKQNGIIFKTESLPGDKRGYSIIDLKNKSLFHEIVQHHKRFRSTAAVYENVMNEVHNLVNHKYSFSNTVLEADAFISLCKLKTHRKTGVTLSLKNMVGLTNEKRWLPHHRIGSISEGGDSIPDKANISEISAHKLHDFFQKHKYGKIGLSFILPAIKFGYNNFIKYIIKYFDKNTPIGWSAGDWYGNDTVWRMVLDLNQILFYSDKNGEMREKPQKRYFSCVDGVIAGEKDGPLNPSPKSTGLIIGGFNPVSVDLACIKLMGFDYKKIPLMWGVDKVVNPLFDSTGIDTLWRQLKIVSNYHEFTQLIDDNKLFYQFEPSDGWKGHIEHE